MKFTKIALALASASTALAITAGASHADAGPDSGSESVNYVASVSDTVATVEVDKGSLVVERGVLQIVGAGGTVLAGTELSFRVDDFVFPIDVVVADRMATLTPRYSLDRAQYKPVALPYEDQATWKNEYDREKDAWSRMTSTIALGASVGTLTGAIGGAAVGCALGGVTGAVLSGALATMFAALPSGVQGCIAGVGAGGFLGALAGQLFVTAPVAIAAAAQYFTTINQPMPQRAE
ncbi:hypothetical protein ACFVAV_18610 [Nocardia sp. NPDC057663]|uniref:hypothetical protein n=1 Tax=Nocardia sp. NPDC057663 TaxID=3346201 RepID=UPI003671DCBE